MTLALQSKIKTRVGAIVGFIIVGVLAGIILQHNFVDRTVFDLRVNTRTIKVAVYYPERVGGQATKLPTVLYSHALMGCAFESLASINELVDAGYVVVAPDHHDRLKFCYINERNEFIFGVKTYSDFPFMQNGKSIEPSQFFSFLTGDEPSSDIKAINQDVINYATAYRTEDLAIVYKRLKELNASGEVFPKRLIDMDRIGIMGFSVGGAAVINFVDRYSKDFPVKAVLLKEPTVDPAFAERYKRVIVGNNKTSIFMGLLSNYPAKLLFALGLGGTDIATLPNSINKVVFPRAGHLSFAEQVCHDYPALRLGDACRLYTEKASRIADETQKFFDSNL